MKKRFFYSTVLGASLLAGAAQVNADTLYGFNSSKIAVIDSLNLGAVSYLDISGLSAGERLLGVDLRPTDGLVYGLTSQNRLYTLDTTTGAATFKSTLSGASVAGQSIGIDFNPVADFAGASSLRVITGTGNNYAINANTGAVGNVAGANIGSGYTAVSYINSIPGTAPTSTGLYYVNTNSDSLHFLGTGFNNPAGAGGIQLVGSLGVNALSAGGFDVLGNGHAYALFNLDDGTLDSQLFSINLATGTATYLTTLNGTFNGLTGVAAVPEPSSYALVLVGLGLMAGAARRQSRQRQ
ncbi:DUF4394 domain-containing protein [Methylophilus sp.]|jgi:hypothetical protein|uniref:DUF4394 domain-containing protein n=1 Tax=Methylophilus sp. TaxID=29541 RepID=UPI0011D4A1C5|nr:DUF4394 domain-containing protein [Methylophilus sp.]TXI45639.1 MAG: DUF4394 domain-containing protein [Methylophilus sp.]